MFPLIIVPDEDLLLGVNIIEYPKGKGVRQCERQAVLALLQMMLGVKTVVIEHKADGMPLLEGWHVSISHTKGFAAVLLSKRFNVGVDIEYNSIRVSKIATRFLREDEFVSDVSQQLVFWTAKESVFKLFSEDRLTFGNMVVSAKGPIVLSDSHLSLKSQQVLVKNVKRNKSIVVYSFVTKAFTLSYCCCSL